MRKFYLPLAVGCALLTSCAAPRISSRAPQLEIPQGTITVDGSAEDWGDCRQLTSLTSAHDHTTPDGTRVALRYDNTKLYFLFEVTDPTIVTGPIEDERGLFNHDRVEIFFSSDRKMSFYCGAEMAEAGVLDHGREIGGKSSMKWNFKTLHYKVARTAEGYVTEGSLDLEELRELGLIGRNGRIYIGLFRGDNPDDGTKYRWLSWVVADKLPRPNFHHPYSQGVAYLR